MSFLSFQNIDTTLIYFHLSVCLQCSPCSVPADVNYYEDGDNAIVNVAKVISGQLGDMVEYMGGGDSSIKVRRNMPRWLVLSTSCWCKVDYLGLHNLLGLSKLLFCLASLGSTKWFI